MAGTHARPNAYRTPKCHFTPFLFNKNFMMWSMHICHRLKFETTFLWPKSSSSPPPSIHPLPAIAIFKWHFHSIKLFDGKMWSKSIEMTFFLNDETVNGPQMIIRTLRMSQKQAKNLGHYAFKPVYRKHAALQHCFQPKYLFKLIVTQWHVNPTFPIRW